MRREPKAGGGDQHQGVSAPHVIAARTSGDALPLPGDPHHNIPHDDQNSIDPLWPLVTVLGDIARRISWHASEATVATAQSDHSKGDGSKAAVK